MIVNSVSCNLGKFRHADKVRELLNRKDSVIPMGENTGGNDLLNKIKDLLGGTAKEQADGEPAPPMDAAAQAQADVDEVVALANKNRG